jgi:16S rRNA G966 N2-methylase RsmD
VSDTISQDLRFDLLTIDNVMNKDSSSSEDGLSPDSSESESTFIIPIESSFLSSDRSSESTFDSSDPRLETLIKQNLESTLPSSYYSSLLPYQKPQVKTVLLTIFPNENANLTIVDCTSHIGGDAIHFSTVYPHSHIYAIDIDPDAIKCLERNISTLGMDDNNFTLVTSDVVSWIRKTKLRADFYYFDPPWGGPKYYKEYKLHLYLGNERIEDIINEVFEYNLTNTILLKIPRNFDMEDFRARVKYHYKTEHIKKVHKRKAIAYDILIINSIYS